MAVASQEDTKHYHQRGHCREHPKLGVHLSLDAFAAMNPGTFCAHRWTWAMHGAGAAYSDGHYAHGRQEPEALRRNACFIRYEPCIRST